MNKITRRLAAAMFVAASVCTGQLTIAQNAPSQNPSSKGNAAPTDRAVDKAGMTHDKSSMHHNKTGMHGAAMGMMDDATFLKKAYQGGLAEIELGKLAQEKASSDKVKSYGQEMVDAHTMANQMIAGLFSDQSGNNAMANGATNADANASGAGTGTATGTGSGSMATGVGTDAGAGVGTAGNTGSMNSITNPNALNKTNAGTLNAKDNGTNANTGNTGVVNSNNTNSATVDANKSSDNDSAVAGSAGAVPVPPVNPNNPSTPDMNNAGNMMANSMPVSPELKAQESVILSTELSPEQKALKQKLSGLSGAAFDKAYLQAMVKDHTKMLGMVEAKAKEDASPGQAWAQQHESVVRQHKEKAIKLMEKEGSSSKK